MSSGGGRAARIAEEQAREERERQARIRLGMQRVDDTFREFNDGFFNRIRQAQLDYTLPDLNRQYQQAREKLTYALARGGTLRSSLAAQRGAELAEGRQSALNRADTLAEEAVRRARSDIEDERSALVMELQATADPEAAANAAQARAGFLRAQRPDQDLGILFQNATAGLAAALRPRYDAYGQQLPRSGMFFRPQDRSRTVGG